MQKAFPHSRIEQEGREALCRLLNEVPGISNIEVIQGNSNAFVTVQSTPNKTPTASPRKAATMASKEETP